MSRPGSEERPERPWIALLVVNLVVVVPIVILLASNTRNVRLEWLGLSARLPLFAIILFSFVAGVVLDEVVGIAWRVRRRRRRRLEVELDELRRQATPPPENAE